MDALTEADTRSKLIDPALYDRGWNDDLRKEEQTLGAVTVTGGRPRRSRGRVDYLLRVRVNAEAQPVAVALLEAKRNTLPPGHGLDQAKGYARAAQHHVPFVFSSNGYLFVEFDRTTGLTAPARPLAEFPTPDDLRRRYEAAVGFPLTAPAARPLLTKYAGGEGGRRYFQDAAIRAVFEAVARAAAGTKPRALLSLATGTGKTFIAVNLLKRLADAGHLKKALFLCDRDELRRQGLEAMKALFGADAEEVYEDKDGRNHAKNARVHVATYQTLGVDADAADASFLTRHYPENYFSHIVIDECHRSAWGKWSAVLTRNPDAVQIGLTATPRQLDCGEDTAEARADAQVTADNLRYFGPPAYEYGLAQAMDDGYLAACEIALASVNLDQTGLTAAEVILRNPTNAITGRPVSAADVAAAYQRTDYETALLLPDRVRAMCWDLFNQMLQADPARGPHQKTIIFCARDAHAERVTAEMNNLYATWCELNGRTRAEPYSFRCTQAGGGQESLIDFKGRDTAHFVATTVELLTTGVDVPKVRNIVFFRYMRSPITFYQMVGRGTRIDTGTDKLLFRVYDYTGATRLFGQGFVTAPASEPTPDGGTPPTGDDFDPRRPPVVVEGFEVHIRPEGRYVVMPVNGVATPVPVEDYKAGLSKKLVEECPTLDEFRARWVSPGRREEVITAVVAAGYSPAVLRLLDDRAEYDLYDVLADLGYGLAPKTRADRAFGFRYKHRGWLSGLPGPARAAVEAVADQFARDGTDGLESRFLFDTPEVARASGVAALRTAGEPADLIRQTKERIFTA